jgi:hypothetical protein
MVLIKAIITGLNLLAIIKEGCPRQRNLCISGRIFEGFCRALSCNGERIPVE